MIEINKNKTIESPHTFGNKKMHFNTTHGSKKELKWNLESILNWMIMNILYIETSGMLLKRDLMEIYGPKCIY